MSSKIYSVWGGKHSGKTTFAVSLACALSKRDKLVGLISSNLTYGELQTFFGQSVPEEKGIFEALREKSPNIGERFSEYTESKNLFFLSVPTAYSGMLSENVTLEETEQLIHAASLVFDILIIDGASQINNPVSGVGLWLSDTIFTLHRPSIAAQMWYSGVSDFMRELHITEKQKHILLAPNGEFDTQTYQGKMPLPFYCELPYIKSAAELENAGTPLYFASDRPCRRYGKVTEQIAGKICGGGKG